MTKIISYIDPRIIAASLYLLYMAISIGSLATLLIYIPFYLKKDDDKIKKLNNKNDYIQNVANQIEFAIKSKYFRASLARLIGKGLAFKDGYIMVSVSDTINLIKENKINMPDEIKEFLIESLEFYSSFQSIHKENLSISSFLKYFLKKQTDPQDKIDKTIKYLYNRFND